MKKKNKRSHKNRIYCKKTPNSNNHIFSALGMCLEVVAEVLSIFLSF